MLLCASSSVKKVNSICKLIRPPDIDTVILPEDTCQPITNNLLESQHVILAEHRRELYEAHAEEGLQEISRQKPTYKNRVAEHVERTCAQQKKIGYYRNQSDEGVLTALANTQNELPVRLSNN